MSEVRKDLAARAKDKKATFGPDIDLFNYELIDGNRYKALELKELTEDDRRKIIQSGVDLEDETRAGTFLQSDNQIVHCAAKQHGLEVLPMAQALMEFPWLEELYWQ